MAIVKNIWLQSALAFALALLIVGFHLTTDPPITLDPDSEEYLSVAYTLYDTGIFTDGDISSHAALTGENGEGMFFAPLYPAFLSLLIDVSPTFRESARCIVIDTKGMECGAFPVLIYSQMFFGALAAFLVWLSGYVVTGRKSVAWLAMTLSLLAEAYAYYAGIMLTETLVFPLFTGACLTAVLGWKHRSPAFWLLTGILLGALALTRPANAYLFYAALPALAVTVYFLRNIASRRKIAMPLMLLAGYVLLAGPWMVRNEVKLGEFGISKGYAGFILVQRAAFNDMSWKEWRASFIYSLPDFGDELAKDLFPPEHYERFDYANPDGFYQTGNNAFREKSIKQAGGKDKLLGYLVKTEVIGNAAKHIAVTFSLLWRGIWVSKYWGLIALPLFTAVFFTALRRGWWAFVIFALPPWFMAGFHAFTSVNVVRYNLILIPSLAIGSAIALLWLGSWLWRRAIKVRGTASA